MADELFEIRGDAPAAPDLMFWSVLGHESLSRSSWYELTVLSKKADIVAKDVLGHPFDVVIRFQDPEQRWHERHCHGHAVRFLRLGQVGRYFEYRIRLRSWFWLLTKRRNSRILQDASVLDALAAVFEDSPIRRFGKFSADGVVDPHKPHRYCVQFEESDHDYLSRLLEDEGIYYWFDAHDAPGTMRLADTVDVAHDPLPVMDTLDYQGGERGHGRFNEVSSWIDGRRLDAGKWAGADSNFKTIRRRLGVEIDAAGEYELADFEEFEFAGGFFNEEDRDAVARWRADERIARHERAWAVTRWPDVAPGSTFKYAGDPGAQRNGEYLIGSCTFVATHSGYEGMGDSIPSTRYGALLEEMLAGDPFNQGCEDTLLGAAGSVLLAAGAARGARLFVSGVMPRAVPYKPPRLTPRARMPGPQSAIVVGPDGEELHVDEFGRVKVHFHWDRYDASNEKSTCWVRVSQPWAGQGWGGYFAPRVGQEVIVDFLNGDPDRPIIMGRVYNDDEKIPYDSPTQSGFRTRSTPGGGAANYSEIMFEDKKGAENLNVHAERNMTRSVECDDFITVGHDQALKVMNERSHWVEKKEKITIKERQEIEVGPGGQKIKNDGNQENLVGGGQRVVISKGRNTQIGLLDLRYVDGDDYVQAKGLRQVDVGANYTHNVTGDVLFQSGAARTDVTQAAHNIQAGTITAFANKGDVSIVAENDINLIATNVNQIVSGNRKETTSSSDSTFKIGASHQTSISASSVNNISAKLENALGISLTNSLGVSISNKIALEISNTGGLDLKNSLFGTERKALKLFQPGPATGSGTSSSGMQAFHAGATIVGFLLGSSGLGFGIGQGIAELENTVESEKEEIRKMKDDAVSKLENLRNEARNSGRNELADRISALQEHVRSIPESSDTENKLEALGRVGGGVLAGAAVGGVLGPVGAVAGAVAGGVLGANSGANEESREASGDPSSASPPGSTSSD